MLEAHNLGGGGIRRILYRTVLIVCGIALWVSASGATEAADREYEVVFRAEFVPQRGIALAEIELQQSQALARQFKFRAPAPRYKALSADGELKQTTHDITWRPPASGGVLRYEFQVDRYRDSSKGHRYDARITGDWALLRAGHLFPSASVTAVKGARSRSSLMLTGPDGWLFETRYGPTSSKPLPFSDPDRSFDRPTGWMLAGEFGIRRQIIAERGVAVVAPKNTNVDRMVIIAMLNWNLAELVRVFPNFPDRLLIVSADDPMWRGGLSGPSSLYLHADRRLISENGTSTLLHELVHVASQFSAKGDDDWIVEGLAEYYGIELMRRSGTMTEPRFHRTLGYLQNWAAKRPQSGLRADSSKGATTAVATLLLHQLDQEIRQLSQGEASLDDVVKELAKAPREISFARLVHAVREVTGKDSAVLSGVEL